MIKLKNWGVNLGLTLGSLVLGVLIGEIGLRVAGIEGYQRIGDVVDSAPTIFHASDRDRGWALKPGASGNWRNEGESFVQINSQGLRDREHNKVKPKNTLRIAVLGDSFTEAIHVPMERTFWAKMENSLQKCSSLKGKKVEVINFGVQGYGTAQELITLRKKVWDYNPDIVILAFFIGNDLINNSPQLEQDRYRPFFVYDKNGKLVADMSFRNLPPIDRNRYAVSIVDRLPAWLVNNSRILQVGKKVELDFKKRQISDNFTAMVFKNLKEPEDQTWQEAWRVTEDLIVLMRDEVVEKKADFLLVTIGDPLQVQPDPLLTKDLIQQQNIQDLFYADKRLQKLGDRAGFPVLNLAQPFQTYAQKNKVCLHGFDNALACRGHWNAEGHQLAAKIITEKLCERLKQIQPKAVK
ncbi:lipolytic protein G-D-S-L family [Oscillatoriales cyanobacterium USR001]|nr:lipolytic protein G-D-S-L family [Oscillatoriales cyanobacterium USR001]